MNPKTKFPELRPALVALLLWTAITGVVYPLAITGIAQLCFLARANGSLLHDAQGRTVGSELIGQPFSDSKYFWGRLSATGGFPNNAFDPKNLTGSSGSNYGPLHPELLKAVNARIEALRQADPGNMAAVPVDLVTASASGLDPHISPAAAEYQAARVARARNLPIEQVRQLIAKHTEGRTLGILGEARVNVLALNRSLDAQP